MNTHGLMTGSAADQVCVCVCVCVGAEVSLSSGNMIVVSVILTQGFVFIHAIP